VGEGERSQEILRRICASIAGKLHGVACSADIELQGHAGSCPIPFVGTVGIAWTAYLSLTNLADEE
jgi:hypothetical protein